MSSGHPSLRSAQNSSGSMGCGGPSALGSASPAKQEGTRILEREGCANSRGVPVQVVNQQEYN